MSQVRVQLQGTHALPVWSAKEPESSLNLPSFNAYPQLSVTAAGEYLMMLPQMLESLLNDSQEGLDSEWLDKVRSHTVCSVSLLSQHLIWTSDTWTCCKDSTVGKYALQSDCIDSSE